jgi:hypothetical protein
MLPDDVLLEIFAFHVEEIDFSSINAWHTLVHVCQKWRIVVFGSPRSLNLRLQCGTTKERAQEKLDIWPLLPIVLRQCCFVPKAMDYIMAALEHNDRVCEIKLWNAKISEFMPAMQEPFPTLTILYLSLGDAFPKTQVIPNSFLGGSAPRLRELTLVEISFPGLPKLLPSATHLVQLRLSQIPHSGYISPEAMVTCLSALTRLQTLSLGFQSPQSRPDREGRRPHLLTHSILPALTDFAFSGVSKYLEDFVERIDAPMLSNLHITFFYQVMFNIPNLPQFISRTPNLKARDEACLDIYYFLVHLAPVRHRGFQVALEVSPSQTDWLSPFAQICRSSFPHTFISSLENLYIRECRRLPSEGETTNAQWLELFHPFTAVKNLYLSKEITLHIASVLHELVGERVVEILPALQGLFLEEVNPARPVREAIGQFVAARQLSSHPIAVSHWVKEEDEW